MPMSTPDPTNCPVSPARPTLDPSAPSLSDTARREALRKLGRLAAWTAPTMLTLMVSARADDSFGSPGRPG